MVMQHIYLFTYTGPKTSKGPFGAVKLSALLGLVLLFKVESEEEAQSLH